MGDQAEVNRPKSIVHSLAAQGRNEEGLGGVEAALPQHGSHCPIPWEVVWTENPEMVWEWETAESAERPHFQV